MDFTNFTKEFYNGLRESELYHLKGKFSGISLQQEANLWGELLDCT